MEAATLAAVLALFSTAGVASAATANLPGGTAISVNITSTARSPAVKHLNNSAIGLGTVDEAGRLEARP